MQEPPPVEALVARLKAFARNVNRVLADPGINWQACRLEGEWSLTEVVCHLRDVEREVHQPRIKALAREDGAFLPGAVADDWVSERVYYKQNGSLALESFLAARNETLAQLSDFDETLWRRQGQHSFFGPTTMHELLYLMVQHDEAHWEQIRDLLES